MILFHYYILFFLEFVLYITHIQIVYMNMMLLNYHMNVLLLLLMLTIFLNILNEEILHFLYNYMDLLKDFHLKIHLLVNIFYMYMILIYFHFLNCFLFECIYFLIFHLHLYLFHFRKSNLLFFYLINFLFVLNFLFLELKILFYQILLSRLF